MPSRFSPIKYRQFFAVAISLIIPVYLSFAATMQSSSYKIPSDTLNFGGVAVSTSSSYFLSDSLGENATGPSNSTDYILGAGFWHMQETYLAISSPSDISLSAINGLTGGASIGQADWHVTTDNSAGYSLSIKANQSPALKSSNDSFADYTPAGTVPDFTFTITNTASAFGFSPEGPDITQTYKDNGTTCGVGSGDTINSCWAGLTTSGQIISQATANNQPNGATTTVKFEAKSGSAHIQTSGNYSTSITVTAVVL